MTPPIRSRAAALEMDPEPDERRAMVRVARLATDRAQPAPAERRPQPQSAPRPATVWDQTMKAATAWMYLAPLLCVSPFLWNPPLWIAALTQLPERRPKAGSRR
ncbi:MAG TPA: hypothetical protein VMQ11_11615 [Alphaproteobacteria bacterium]|nr:hypothetical protein [Alphaproteobacteria bacterium]